MGQVTVRVNGRQYQVACDDGQEDRLSELSVQLDQRIEELRATVGSGAGEQRLLVMAALLLVDEVSEARAEAGRLRAAGPAAPEPGDRREETALADTLALMAARIEAIADKFEAG